MTRAEQRLYVLGFSVITLVIWAAAFPVGDWFLYNPSPSMPPGFYRRSEELIMRGAIVTVRARAVAPDYAALKGFADEGDRFIKRVVGVNGDVVCAEGHEITLNAALIARRETHDSEGRTLPSWEGCRELAADEFFLLGDTDDSFDSRYWGVVTSVQIEGVWRPVL